MNVRCLIAGLCLGVAALCVSGCDSNDNGDPVAITGDSTLVVNNTSDADFSMYFDGQYIGDADHGKSKTWSVPSGTHKVKAEGGLQTLEQDYS